MITITAADSPYSFGCNTAILLVDSSAGNVTIRLPQAQNALSSRGQFRISKITTDSNLITITPFVGETINQETSYSFRDPISVIVFPSESTYWTITAAALNPPVVSVKDFGAIGDGTTDDTIAIQAAINFVNNQVQGGVVYFPTSNYKITTALTISGNGTTIGPFVSLKGDGPRRTVITNSGTTHAISLGLTWSGPPGPYFDFWWFPRIEGFEIVGSTTSAVGINVGSSIHTLVIKDCWIRNHGQQGIKTGASYAITIEDCYIFQCGLSGIYDGILLESTTHLARLSKTSSSGHTRNGLRAHGVSAATSIVQCDFESNTGSGVDLSSIVGAAITGCYFEFNASGGGTASHIFLESDCQGVSIGGNYFNDSAIHASVRCDGCTGVDISGNVSTGGQNFVVITTTALDVHVGKNSSDATVYVQDNSGQYSLSVDRCPESGQLYDIKPTKSGGLNQRVHSLTSTTTGITDRVGDVIWNSSPASGSTMGWVCTSTGTPGTWKVFATIS